MMRWTTSILALASVLVAIGCGGESDQRSVSTGGAAAEFRKAGSDNSIQSFGHEGSEGERRQAAAALHAFLDAGARGDLRAACEQLSGPAKRAMAAFVSPALARQGCVPALGALWKDVPDRTFEEAAQADVGSLRVDGPRAFVLYHGARGSDYQMPMVREDGEWKVATISASPLL
jgi:hypothetical protein